MKGDFKMFYKDVQISIDEVVIYLRKSQSDEPSMSVEEVLKKHEDILQEFCENEFGQKLPDNQIYREVASGETIDDRPVIQNIMQQMETGLLKGVIVIEPQRFSRGDLQDCGRMVNALRYTNTLAITPQKTYDLNDEYDRKFFEMELTKGSDYLEYYKKIQRRGREASVKRGNYIGSVTPYGYNKLTYEEGKRTCHTLEINPIEADAIKIMVDLYLNKGYGFTKIARALDEYGFKPRKSKHWSPAAIKDIIENPVIIGKIRWNHRKTVKKLSDGEIVKSRPNNKNDCILVDGKHEAIIDEETYNKILDKRGKNPRLRKSEELTNPYAGLLYCGTCGRAMSHKKYKQVKTQTDTISQSMICNNQANCHTRSVMYSAFEAKVIESMTKEIKNFEIKLKNSNGNSKKLHINIIKNLESDLKALNEKDEKQKDYLEDGIYTKAEYLKRNAKLQEQIVKTREALIQARNSTPTEVDYKEKILKFQDCLNALNDPNISAAQKNMILKTCIRKIVYRNNSESKPGIGRYVDNPFELDVYFYL